MNYSDSSTDPEKKNSDGIGALQAPIEATSKAGYLEAMKRLGFPVPPFFIIQDAQLLDLARLREDLKVLEQKTGKSWAKPSSGWNMLCVSVRSSFGVSMPGMLDSILNIGLTRDHAAYLDDPVMWASYVKLIEKYGYLIAKIPEGSFPLTPKSADATIAREFEVMFKQHAGYDFPQHADEQLLSAIRMVRESWNNARAQAYREHEHIHAKRNVDVVVQTMVFGNRDAHSGTGIVFTRNPSTGDPQLFGEYLPQCQGEDIVSGNTNPLPIASLQTSMPKAYHRLQNIARQLECTFLDMQDVEFTIECGTVWILQTRSGKRSKLAELRILEQYVKEGILSEIQALQRIYLQGIESAFHPYLKHAEALMLAGEGIGASPGAACGVVAMRHASVLRFKEKGFPVIFAAQETHCEDIASIMDSDGVITSTGGVTCHAAVVTRGLGKPCITSASHLHIHEGTLNIENHSIAEGDWITMDGSSGKIFLGKGLLCTPKRCDALEHFLNLARQHGEIKVYANADTPTDWHAASAFNPLGIGLCRSEHMFFQDSHLPWFQGLILSKHAHECADKISKLQEDDYYAMLSCVEGKRFTVRLLDPPLHEFLPSTPQAVDALAEKIGMNAQEIMALTHKLKENNPMLGQRGCRLAFVRPDICDLQLHALFKACLRVAKESKHVNIGIMIPFVMVPEEFAWLKRYIQEIAATYVTKAYAMCITWDVGVMIEVPSAALQAEALAEIADFVCFGTNDLTQMTLGLSRDDTANMLQQYQHRTFVTHDPFQSIHQNSVGKLLAIACSAILRVNPNMHISVCGEHGGDLESMKFFYTLGVREVSCSAYRIPKAQLASAKITLSQHGALEVESLSGTA